MVQPKTGAINDTGKGEVGEVAQDDARNGRGARASEGFFSSGRK